MNILLQRFIFCIFLFRREGRFWFVVFTKKKKTSGLVIVRRPLITHIIMSITILPDDSGAYEWRSESHLRLITKTLLELNQVDDSWMTLPAL